MDIDDLFPILSTSDIERLAEFYRDVLGGQVHYQFPPEGPPAYVGLQFGRASLGIGLDTETAAAGRQRVALWVYAADCDRTVDRVRAAGGKIVEEPADQPWGERIARIEDPDGNQVVVGQRAPA